MLIKKQLSHLRFSFSLATISVQNASTAGLTNVSLVTTDSIFLGVLVSTVASMAHGKIQHKTNVKSVILIAKSALVRSI